MTYKLLAMDLDGTLIGNDLVISDRVQRAVAQAASAGVRPTLATGRMFQASMPFASLLKITAPLICYQGAMIRDPVSGETLFHLPVPLDAAREAIAEAERLGHVALGYVDDWVYAGPDSPEARFYAKHSQVQPRFVGNLLDWLKEPPTKLVIVTTEDQTDANVRHFRELFGSRLNVTKSYPLFTEVIHPSVSKGAALARLAELLQVEQAEVVALGDNLNDQDMVAYAGLGIAMGNGASSVKAVAKWVTASQADDGVAVAIEQRVLGRP